LTALVRQWQATRHKLRHGSTAATWKDIASELEKHEAFKGHTVHGPTCKDHFEGAVKQHESDANAAPWHSGDDEEVTVLTELLDEAVDKDTGAAWAYSLSSRESTTTLSKLS
ncbi:unnamed protein product, partial [Phaeothamnion confervicola]